MTLDDVLSKYKNSSLEERKIQVEKSVANKAILQSLPAISPSISYYMSVDSSTASSYRYSQGLSLSQKVFNAPDYISIFNNWENMHIANLSYRLKNHQLINSILNDYFLILQYRMKIELDTALIKREEINVKKNESMMKSGLISETDYYNIKANYYNIQYAYQNDLNTYDKLKTEFELLTGIKEADLLEMVDTIPSFDLDFNEKNLVEEAPEVVLAKKTYYIAKNNEASAYLEFLPTASFTASANVADTALYFDRNMINDNYTLSTSLRINFPIFTGLSRDVNVIAAGGARKTSQIDYIKTKQGIENEVRNLKKTIKQTMDLYSAAEMTHLSLKNMFEKVTKLYDAGEVSTVDYITNQKSYVESAVNLINAKSEVYKLYYRYLYLLRRI